MRLLSVSPQRTKALLVVNATFIYGNTMIKLSFQISTEPLPSNLLFLSLSSLCEMMLPCAICLMLNLNLLRVFYRSDVLGHILPIVGQDWAQGGVAQLFTKIKNNGYRILYLSARAIGQARITREYLRSVRQGDLSLPDGPLLLNPTSLLSALHR